MAFRARAVGLLALMALAPALALAQGQPPAAPSPATGSEQAAAAPSAPASGSAAETAASAKPVVPATGYGWTEAPKKSAAGAARNRPPRSRRSSSDAILPGFETLADGSTRLFVELSKPVAYDTKAGRGSVTYVLKGAHVDRRNNYNPLVTVHFNTPVTSARLVPHGKDLWFVVELRARVQPSVLMDTTKDGGAMLRIEFAKGDYLPAAPAPSAGSAPPPPPPAASSASATPPVASTTQAPPGS